VGWETLLEEISSCHNVGMIGCRVCLGNKGFWAESADYFIVLLHTYQKKQFIELGSAAIVVKKQAFMDVQGFDETLLVLKTGTQPQVYTSGFGDPVFTRKRRSFHFHGRESFVAIAKNAYRSGFPQWSHGQKKHYAHISACEDLGAHGGLLGGMLIVFRTPWP